jgi:RND family efflux transporter MFP subunit
MRGVAVLCGAILVLGAGACSRPHAEVRSADVPAVAVATVTREDLAQRLTVAAEFRPYQEIDVYSKVSGYLRSIAVDVGDHVRQGQLLAVLEVPELRDELQQDEASVMRATEEINRAQADLERAESAHEMAHLGSTRLESAGRARPNLIARQDLDEALGRDRMAEAQVSTAKAALASARQQQAIAKAARAKTQTLFAYARIAAPFAGVITRRYADTGAMIQAGTSSQTQTLPLVKLSQNTMLRLVLQVPESAVGRIHDREPVEVRVDSIGKTYPGTLTRLSERLDTDTRSMHVEVDVANPTLALVPGMFAQASITLDQAKQALVVPLQAIDRVNGQPRVVVVKADRTIEPRDVGLGLETADRVAVTSGLAAGDLVVIGNRGHLKPGTAVSPKVQGVAAPQGER